MMHSSSGCGEKISARGASAASAGRGGAGNRRAEIAAFPDQPRELGDVAVIRIHAAYLRDRRQAGRGDRLTVTLVVLVRNVERDLPGQLGELDLQHLARAGDDVVSARARGHASEHQHVTKIVERREMRDAVADVRADGLVNLLRAVIAVEHERLDDASAARAAACRRASRSRPPA